MCTAPRLYTVTQNVTCGGSGANFYCVGASKTGWIDLKEGCTDKTVVAINNVRPNELMLAQIVGGVCLMAMYSLLTCIRTGCCIGRPQAVPVAQTDTIPSSLKDSGDTASFFGTGINDNIAQQLMVPFPLTVTRAVQVAVTWEPAMRRGWQVKGGTGAGQDGTGRYRGHECNTASPALPWRHPLNPPN
jgi:hypothetical protein